MHIVEQTPDRLLIEDRKSVPDVRWGLAPALLIALPLFVAYWNARLQPGSWKLLVLIGAGWIVIAAIYAVMFLARAAPRIDLDARSGRARIGGGDVPLDSITFVSLSGDGQLTFDLRDGDETMFPRVKSTTDAERARAVKAIRGFLKARRAVATSTSDPYRDLQIDEYVEPFEDAVDPADTEETTTPLQAERAAAERWAEKWDAESTAGRTCVFCEERHGDGAPLRLWATHERLDLTSRIYVPRCRRCARVHDLHKRIVPAVVLLITWPAAVTFFMVRVIDHVHAPLTFAVAFILVALGIPALAFALARLLTRPALFGTKDATHWRELPSFAEALRSGWTLQVSVFDRWTA